VSLKSISPFLLEERQAVNTSLIPLRLILLRLENTMVEKINTTCIVQNLSRVTATVVTLKKPSMQIIAFTISIQRREKDKVVSPGELFQSIDEAL